MFSVEPGRTAADPARSEGRRQGGARPRQTLGGRCVARPPALATKRSCLSHPWKWWHMSMVNRRARLMMGVWLRSLFGTRSKQQTMPPLESWNARPSERPAGHNWRRWSRPGYSEREAEVFSLSGIPYREPVIVRLLQEAQAIEHGREGQYGLVLRREPTNNADPNAIAVFGWCYDPAKLHHLGYLWREDAEKIAAELPPDVPLAAELSRVFVPEPTKLWIGLHVCLLSSARLEPAGGCATYRPRPPRPPRPPPPAALKRAPPDRPARVGLG